MKISEILQTGPSYSFEFFPPRDEQMEEVLAQTLRDLEPLRPSYVSVTYGAGGTTRERTHDLVVADQRRHVDDARWRTSPAPRTRAPSWSRSSTRYRDAGIDNILALGGDPPKDLDLPAGRAPLRDRARATSSARSATSASASPRTRSRTRGRRRVESDRRHTAEKLREADFAITQFFFDADHYFDLVESLRALGVDKPVIAGIMPVTSLASDQADGRDAGLGVPGVARRQARTPSATTRRRSGRSAIAEATKLCADAARGRGAGPALLHAEPLDRDPRDLRAAGLGRSLQGRLTCIAS